MRNATRRNSGRRRRSELLGFEARLRAAVYDGVAAVRGGTSGSPKSMMDNSRPVRVLLYMPVLTT